MLKNYMEEAVEYYLPVVLENYQHVCKCVKCINDIKAIALNELRPLYYATNQGQTYIKTKEFEAQFKVNILNELTKAIKKVSSNIKHD